MHLYFDARVITCMRLFPAPAVCCSESLSLRLRFVEMIASLVLLTFLVEPLLASTSSEPPLLPDSIQIINLWPEGVPGIHADAAPEKIVDNRVMGVHYPSLTHFPPNPKNANGTSVVFCPGGGYVRLAVRADGGREVKFLTELGLHVFVLKYRLSDYGHPAPLRDVLRALRIVRSRAGDYGLKTDRIGVMGASAGGHLSLSAATLWDSPLGYTGNALDTISARPDFVIAIYPVVTMEDPFAHKGSRTALFGAAPSSDQIQALSLEKQVRKDMPQVFLVATMADKSVPVENSLRLYQALRDVGVPTEMHVYSQGAHGSSLDPQYGPTAQWLERLREWLRFIQMVNAPVPVS